MGMVPQTRAWGTSWTPRRQETPLANYRTSLQESLHRLVNQENVPRDHPHIATLTSHLTKRQAYMELEALWATLQASSSTWRQADPVDLQRRLLEATFLGCDIRYS